MHFRFCVVTGEYSVMIAEYLIVTDGDRAAYIMILFVFALYKT